MLFKGSRIEHTGTMGDESRCSVIHNSGGGVVKGGSRVTRNDLLHRFMCDAPRIVRAITTLSAFYSRADGCLARALCFVWYDCVVVIIFKWKSLD